MIDVAGVAWTRALELGLGAQVVCIEHPGTREDCRLVVFKKGPLRIGYADFVAGVESLDPAYEAVMLDAAKCHHVDVIRYQAPHAVASSPSYGRYDLGTTVIGDLQRWDARALEKPKRASNRLRRSEVRIRRGRATDAGSMHRIYLETLRRQGGSGRYTETYFSLIAESSTWVACLGDEMLGFVSSARSGDRGLYLHGGHRESMRQYYPSDLLFLTMIDEARNEQLRCFDFLASPPKQRGLLDYKRAWGAEVTPLVVSDQVLGWRGRGFSLAYAALNRSRRR